MRVDVLRGHQWSTRRQGRWFRLPLAVALISVMVVAAACGGGSSSSSGGAVVATISSVAVDGGHYTNITPDGLNQLLASKDFPLVNVHIPYEGEIEHTDLFIPFDQIEQHLSSLPADKSARIMLYCRTGRMSDIAARVLVKLGYTDVWNLAGGMIAWEQAGNTLVQRAS